MLNKAVVLGATGGTGTAIVQELIRKGIPTVAFGRSAEKLDRLLESLGRPAHLTSYTGDVFRVQDVVNAAQGADVMFQCASVPYHEMYTRQLPLAESVMEAAGIAATSIVFIDGIYPYGRATTPRVREDHPKQPHTKKGKVKLELERLIFDSRWGATKRLIVRLPDYYGPSANMASYLGMTMEGIAAGRPAMFIGNMKVAREYIYLPDAAHMIVELAGREEAYGQDWNLPGAGVISGQELVRIAQAASGAAKLVLPLRRASLRLIGMFNPVIREIVEMLYLTEEPVVLDGSKYERLIGPITATPFKHGIATTIKTMKKLSS